MPRHPVLTAVLALALTATAGCGKQQTTSARLRDDTAAVVAALNAKDVTSARRALDVLDMDVTAAGRLDQLDAATVTALRAGVTKLKADLALITPKPLVTATPTKPPTHAPPPHEEDKKHHHKGD